MVDRYTKAVLTVIAAALVWLCLWGPAPRWGSPAEAASTTADVNIVAVAGRLIQRTGYHQPGGIPVDVLGEPTVKVSGTVYTHEQ